MNSIHSTDSTHSSSDTQSTDDAETTPNEDKTVQQKDTDLIPIPKEIVWDYDEPPKDNLWRLRRIAMFFPAYCDDPETVKKLYDHLDELGVDEERRVTIETYWRIDRELGL